MADSIYDFVDEILRETEPRLPRELESFINEAADYEESQKDKMKRFARADLESRRGSFIASPYLRTSVIKAGEPVAALAARITGNEDAANRVHRLGEAYTQAQKEMNKESTYPGMPDALARGMLDVGTEITAQAPNIAAAAMSGGGAAAIIGEQALFTADKSYTDALDAGKSQREAAQHAIAMGVIEGGVTGAFNAIGLGGLEKVAAGASKPLQAGVRQALKTFGIETMSELTEEVAVNFGQSVVSWMDNVDPEAMTWDRWKQASKDIFLQTVATMGVYSAPGILAGKGHEKVASMQDRIISLAEKGKVTRTDWKELGFSRMTGETEVERLEAVNFMADQIQKGREADASAPATSPEAQPASAAPQAELEQALGLVPQETGSQELERPTKTDVVEGEVDRWANINSYADYLVSIGYSKEDAIAKAQEKGEDASLTITTPMGEEVESDAATQETAAVEQIAPEEAGNRTGIHDKIAEEIRAGVSLPGLEGETQQSQAEWNDAAKSRMQEDTHWVHSVIEGVKEAPRNLSPIEIAGLNRHMRELGNELGIQVERMNSEDPAIAADAQTQSERVVVAIDELTQVAKAAGTEWGRSGVARKIELSEDYSLTSLVQKERVLKRAPLTQEDVVEISALSKEITSLQDKLAKEQAAHQELLDKLGMEDAIASVKKRSPSKRKVAATARRKQAVAQFRNAAQNLELFGSQSVKDFLKGESGAAVIPVEIIDAGVEVVKAYVNEKFVTFSEFWAAAKPDVDTFDRAEEAFKEAWEVVRADGKIKQLAIKPDQTDEIAKYANRMLRAVVEGGKVDKDEVVNAVHEELSKVVKGIDRRQALDAITRQGRFRTSSKQKTEVQKNLSEVRQQLQLQRRLDALERGEVPPEKSKSKQAVSEEIESLKRQIKDAEDKSPAIHAMRMAKETESYAKRLETRVAEYERQLEEDDVMPKDRKPLPETKRIIDLQYEIEVAKSKVKMRRAKLMAQNMKNHEKAWAIIKGTLNTARTLRTSMDLSAVLRQGGFFVAANPIISARAIPKMLKAAVSEKGAFEIMQEIENRENSRLYKRADLSLTNDAGEFKQQEEAFAGNFIHLFDHIPGIRRIAQAVEGSQRAYTAYLNSVRADVFDHMVATLGKSGKVTDSEARVIANFVNIASGRGSLGKAEPAAETLATVFFAPKYVASRFQLILSEPFKAATGIGHDTSRTRKLIGLEYMRAFGGVIAFYSLVKMLSLLWDEDDPNKPRIGLDPRSSDAGKVIIGNTRLDPLAGLSQTSVLLVRNFWGEKVSAGGKVYDLTREEGKKSGPMADDIYDVNSRFQRSKLSPWLSSAIDARTGENLVGEKVTAGTVALDMITPLVFSDIADTMRDQGYAKGTVLATLAIFGMGLQTYDPKSGQKNVVPNPFAVTQE